MAFHLPTVTSALFGQYLGVFLEQPKRLTKKQRRAVKKVRRLLRKRCPKGVYRVFFKKDSLRKLYQDCVMDMAYERFSRMW